MFLNIFYKSFDSGIFEINRYANVPDETSFIFSVLFFYVHLNSWLRVLLISLKEATILVQVCINWMPPDMFLSTVMLPALISLSVETSFVMKKISLFFPNSKLIIPEN